MTKATKDFRDNGVKVRNSSAHILKEKLNKVDTDELADIIDRDIYKVRDENGRMLQEVRASYEAYQKKIKLIYREIGIMLLAFMLFILVMTIGSDFMDSIRVDVFQKAITSKIKTSEGSMVLVWYTAYDLPYIIAISGLTYSYEWIRKKFEVFL